MSTKLKQNVKIILRNEFGEIIQEQHKKNIAVDNGLEQVALMLGCGGTTFKYIEFGTGNTAPSSTDIKLDNYVASSRQRATIAQTNFCANWTHTWTQTEIAVGTIREAGLFQEQTDNAGTYMLARLTFTLVNKTASDTLTIDWDIAVADDGA